MLKIFSTSFILIYCLFLIGCNKKEESPFDATTVSKNSGEDSSESLRSFKDDNVSPKSHPKAESNLRASYDNYSDGKELADNRKFPEKNTPSLTMKEHYAKVIKLKNMMKVKDARIASMANRQLWFMKQPATLFTTMIHSYYEAHNDLDNPMKVELQFSAGRYTDIKLHKKHLRLPKIAHILTYYMENPGKFETTPRFMEKIKIYFFDFSYNRKGIEAYDVTGGEICAQFEDDDKASAKTYVKFLSYIYDRYGYYSDNQKFGILPATEKRK